MFENELLEPFGVGDNTILTDAQLAAPLLRGVSLIELGQLDKKYGQKTVTRVLADIAASSLYKTGFVDPEDMDVFWDLADLLSCEST
ncbi:hypothetical protein ACFLZ1_02765 [Patescibacteria group bacterium]